MDCFSRTPRCPCISYWLAQAVFTFEIQPAWVLSTLTDQSIIPEINLRGVMHLVSLSRHVLRGLEMGTWSPSGSDRVPIPTTSFGVLLLFLSCLFFRVHFFCQSTIFVDLWFGRCRIWRRRLSFTCIWAITPLTIGCSLASYSQLTGSICSRNMHASRPGFDSSPVSQTTMTLACRKPLVPILSRWGRMSTLSKSRPLCVLRCTERHSIDRHECGRAGQSG